MKNKLCILALLIFQTPFMWSQLSITGSLKNTDGVKPILYLSYLNSYADIFSGYDGIVIDSAEINSNGIFSFKNNSYKDGLYRLNIQAIGSLDMAGMILGRPDENYIHFYLSGLDKTVSITADASALTRSYKINANQESKDIQFIRDLRGTFFKASDSIWLKIQNAVDLNELQLQKIRESAMQEMMLAAREMQKLLSGFIDTTSNVKAGLIATKYYNLGDGYAKYIPYFDSLAKKWEILEPRNCYLSGLNEEIDLFKNSIPIGSEAPEILLPSTSGDSMNLRDIEAKLILIDFWASWCGPCRAENKNTLLPLYRKYHNIGFEVFGVSFDSDRKKWIQAIEKDNYPWIHVIETKGSFNSEVGRIYKVTNIPTTYLLDENWNVIAKNLRGVQLDEFIMTFLGK